MPLSYFKEIILIKKLRIQVSFQSKIAKILGQMAELTRFRYFSIVSKQGK